MDIGKFFLDKKDSKFNFTYDTLLKCRKIPTHFCFGGRVPSRGLGNCRGPIFFLGGGGSRLQCTGWLQEGRVRNLWMVHNFSESCAQNFPSRNQKSITLLSYQQVLNSSGLRHISPEHLLAYLLCAA